MSLDFLISVLVAVLAIVNPLGNIPFFVSLTADYPDDMRRNVIRKTVISASLILIIFAFFGRYIFLVYGITIPSFQIAGGVLLFHIGFTMLNGRRPGTKLTDRDREEALNREAVGIVPLGVPMFAGPGAITTVMIYISQAGGVFDIFSVVLAVIITMGVAFTLLTYSKQLFDRIGHSGTLAFSRIMGLILTAVAMNFIIEGIHGAIQIYF